MVLRQRLMEQMESRMQVEDEELRDLIDMAILEAAEGAYLPLKERLCLRKELFDSFRRLDILQELVDDPTITEIRKQMGKSPKPSPRSFGSSSSRVSHVIP